MAPVLPKNSNRNRSGERDFFCPCLGGRPDMADSAGAKELWTHRYSSRGIKNTIHRPNATRRQYLYIVKSPALSNGTAGRPLCDILVLFYGARFQSRALSQRALRRGRKAIQHATSISTPCGLRRPHHTTRAEASDFLYLCRSVRDSCQTVRDLCTLMPDSG